jgi:tripartite-type tricarboxylate transporter receptor subunit TctC
MKKLLTKLFLLALMLQAGSCFARETITILWGFAIGSNQANTVRAICEELNKSQDKYTFIIGHKPGAGGSIAANDVAANPTNTLVSMSSSFIIRPFYEKTEATHNLDNFTPILVQATGSPLAIASSKFSKLEQLYSAKDVTVGISGVGNISHLVSTELANINPTVNPVNFKSTVEAGTAAAGGHIDVAIGFFPDFQSLLDANKLTVLGYTGKTEIPGYKNLLLPKNKMPEASALTANYAIFASTAMPKDKFIEIHQMLQSANNKPLVLESYTRDLLTVSNLNLEQSQAWYSNERKYWEKQVKRLAVIK